MKKSTLFFIVLNLVCAQFTIAQVGQTFSLRNVAQPSPEAAKFVNYFLTPVNTSTGNANIEIPLYNLSVDGVTIPISLSYHTSGIRVEELSGSVGLGWSLNAGGGIYRNINGQADDRSNTGGFLYTSTGTSFIDYLNANVNDYNTQISSLAAVSNNSLDINQDDYTYNFINHSGSLYFTSAFQLREAMNTNTMFGYDSKAMNTITANDKEGNQFTFSDKETTNNQSFPTGDIFGTTAWKLSSINTTNGKSINFSYNDYTIAYNFHSGDAITHKPVEPSNAPDGHPTSPNDCYGGPYATNGFSFSHSETSLVNLCKLVSTITTSQAIVSFFYSTNSNASNWQQELDRIEVKDAVSGVVIKTISFGYSVFNGDPRLMLQTVTMKGKDLNAVQTYSFSYNSLALPTITSMGKDIFGYYNGAPNTTLLSVSSISGISASLYNADRTVNAVNVKMGTLEQITYPTGGKTKFTYGANKEAARYAPGTRIDQIDVLDQSNNIVDTKTFTYSGLTGRSTAFPCYSVQQQIVDQNFGFSSACWTYSSGYNNLELESPKNFFYNTAITSEKGQNGQDLVTAEYYYDPNDNGDRFGGLLNNGEYQTKLSKVEYYKGSYAPQNLVKDHSYNYSVKSDSTNDYVMYRVDPSYLTNMQTSQGVVPCLNFTPGIEPHFRLRSEWYTLTSDNESDYSSAGTVIKKSEYAYNNPVHYFPTQITTYNSDGTTTLQTNKYVADFQSAAPYGDMVLRNQISPVIEVTVSRNGTQTNFSRTNFYTPYTNIYVPQSIQLQVGAAPLETRVQYTAYDAIANPLTISKDGALTSYLWDYQTTYPIAIIKNADNSTIAYTSFEADGTGNWIIPSATRDATNSITGNKSYPLGSGSISKAGLSASATYIVSYWTLNSTPYTITGTITGFPVKGVTNKGWTYYEHLVTGQTTITISGTGNIDEVRLYPSDAQMTTYTYDPLTGPISSTDAKGETTYYEYDPFQRLMNIRDKDGNIIKHMDYHYQGQ